MPEKKYKQYANLQNINRIERHFLKQPCTCVGIFLVNL